MSLFDAIRTAEQGMAVHRFRSEIAAENIANVHTPGYQRQVVDLQPGSFGAALADASGASTSALGGGPTAGARGAADGAVRIAGVHTEGAGEVGDRGAALTGVIEMMEAKNAFELNVRTATMIKSMMLASLEIGRGS